MSFRKENTPLLARNPSESSKYYFLGKSSESYQGGTTNAVRDADGQQVVETVPEGTTEDEFAPRMLSELKKQRSGPMSSKSLQNSNRGGFWSRMFGGGRKSNGRAYGEVGTLAKTRKAPIKIEPKVFFANERTFLAWMHLSVILAGASIAILAFAEEQNPFSQLYGIILLPVAIAFICYSMYQYARRAAMIRHRHPGPYEDTTGPVVLGVMLMVSITAQFALKLYAISQE